jgi:GGDEF domain-containing protein
VGHIGGDDFIVICQVEQAEAIGNRVIHQFQTMLPKWLWQLPDTLRKPTISLAALR